MTGYELEQFIDTTIRHFWNAKLSQIYRTLKQLEEKELVSSVIEPQQGKPDKRIYQLTPSGKEALASWQNTLMTDIDDIRQPSLIHFFFSGRRDPQDTLVQLKIWLDKHKKRVQYFEHELPRIIEETKRDIEYSEEDEFYWQATRKLGKMVEETKVKWLEEVIKDLQETIA